MVTKKAVRSNAIFRALADPTRREILGLLRPGERTVGGIAAHFSTSRPAISKHLRLLRNAGLVQTRRRGAERLCALNGAPLKLVDDWLRDYQAFWEDNLRRLKTFVEKNP